MENLYGTLLRYTFFPTVLYRNIKKAIFIERQKLLKNMYFTGFIPVPNTMNSFLDLSKYTMHACNRTFAQMSNTAVPLIEETEWLDSTMANDFKPWGAHHVLVDKNTIRHRTEVAYSHYSLIKPNQLNFLKRINYQYLLQIKPCIRCLNNYITWRIWWT